MGLRLPIRSWQNRLDVIVRRAPTITLWLDTHARLHRIVIDVRNGTPQMPRAQANSIAESPFEDVAFAMPFSLNQKCSLPANRMHDLRQRCTSLLNDEMEMVRHNREGKSSHVVAFHRRTDVTDYVITQLFDEPRFVADRASGKMEYRTRHIWTAPS